MLRNTRNSVLIAILALAPAAWAAPAVPLSLAVSDPEPGLNDCMEGEADIESCLGAYAEHFGDAAQFRREMEVMKALHSEDARVRAANAPSPALAGLIARVDEVILSLSDLPVDEQARVERLAERASRLVNRAWTLEEDGRVSSRRHVRLFHRADRTLMKAEEIIIRSARAGR